MQDLSWMFYVRERNLEDYIMQMGIPYISTSSLQEAGETRLWSAEGPNKELQHPVF